MKSLIKIGLGLLFILILIITRAGLQYDLKNRQQAEIKNHNNVNHLNEVSPNSKNEIHLKKGQNKVVLDFPDEKNKSTTSLKVNTLVNQNKINITSNGKLKSSPFEWSIEGTQKDLKQTFNNKINAEVSYGGDKKEKNYKIFYDK